MNSILLWKKLYNLVIFTKQNGNTESNKKKTKVGETRES